MERRPTRLRAECGALQTTLLYCPESTFPEGRNSPRPDCLASMAREEGSAATFIGP